MVMPKKGATDYGAKAQKAKALVAKRDKPIVLSQKTKQAIELMVYDGQKRSDAAKAVGMHDESLRAALTKPQTLAYLNDCMEVLRNSARPRALHTMEKLLESPSESTKFKAAEYLDGQNRGTHTVGATQVNVQINNTVSVTPGYAIDLTDDRPTTGVQIDHLEPDVANGLIRLDDVPEDE